MRSEIEFSNGEPALVRLVGEPAGPAGVASVELGKDVMLVFDMAEPDKIVEALLRAPVQEDARKLIRQMVGDEAHDTVESGIEGVEFEVEPTIYRTALGRLAVLELVRDAMPVPTDMGLWALEAAELAGATENPLVLAGAVKTLFKARREVRNLHERFPHAPGLGRIVQNMESDGELGELILAMAEHAPLKELVDWFRQPEWQSVVDLYSAEDALSGAGSIGWDQVSPGLVDPREGAVTLSKRNLGDTERLEVRVRAQIGAAQRNATLFAHIIAEDTGERMQLIPLELSEENEFWGVEFLANNIRPYRVDISDGLDDPQSTETVFRDIARRRAFRALFAERRGQANRARLHWQSTAEAYASIGSTVLASRARAYACSEDRIGVQRPFIAELSVPIDLI